ncbi:MAG: hypothetical protein ABI600_08865 [Luteolibacter sp.]
MRSWLWMVLAPIATVPVYADEIALSGDASLSGTIRSINEAGVVELSTTLSPEPVFLKAGAVEKVEFSPPHDRPDTPGAVVELINGDLLPVRIEGLDEKGITVMTMDAGRLVIPRGAVKSLQLGVHARKVVYAGPKSIDEWKSDAEGEKNWRFENNALVANGPATIAKNFNTPSQFIFRFSLKWQGNPNFQIFFADPLKPKSEVSDRYYLQFAGAGMELKREASKGNRYTTVILSNRTPEQFPESKLDVEIRVDRKSSRLHLFLNGEPEGAGIDPVKGAPEGNGVTLVSNANNGIEQEIRGIEILELDDSRGRHRSEERGDTKTDSMISRDDDRWGGKLTDIRKTGDGLIFSFKSDFQDAPLELLESDVSTVFFAMPDEAKQVDAPHPFVLRLQANGMLHVSSCSFTENAVSAVHPLLGLLNLRRAGVSALERQDLKPKEAPEK